MFLGHPASRLKSRNLVMGGRALGKTAILPFFTKDGLVSAVLLAHRESGDLHYFPRGMVTMKLRAWGAVALDVDSIPTPEPFIDEIARLWHFDPWWLLKCEVFAHQPRGVIDAIKSSNLSAHLGTNREAYYTRSLERLKWIGTQLPDGGYRLEKFQSMSIPKRTPIESQTSMDRGWHLNNAWLEELIDNWRT